MLTCAARSIAFQSEFTRLMQTYGFEQDESAIALRDTTVKWLEEPSASSDVVLTAVLPQFVSVFQSLTGLPQVQKAFQELQSKIVSLESNNKDMCTQITKLQDENRELTERVQQLEEKAKLEESYFLSYDLASLFVFYFVQPAIKRHYGCTLWSDFVVLLDEKEADLEEGEMTVASFRQWLEPLERDVGVDITTLRQMMTERHTIAHTDLRSAANQSKFVVSLATYIPSFFSVPGNVPYNSI